MTTRLALAAGASLAMLAAVSGCTSDDPEPVPPPVRDKAVSAAEFRLVAFESCADALKRLKTAAKEYVGPWGFGDSMLFAEESRALTGGGRDSAAVPDAAAGAPGAAEKSVDNFSGTNTHEAGVDEPDLVKTDGRRIVTVNRGVLHVIDPTSRTVTGKLSLAAGSEDPMQWSEANLLLHGDRALVLIREDWGGPMFRGDVAKPAGPASPKPRLLLIDLAGKPKLISDYRIDGRLVDARQVGSTARVVVRSAPRLAFPDFETKASDAQRIAANRKVIDRAGEGDWFPRYTVSTNGTKTEGLVGCGNYSRPAAYSGTSLVTVLSFDLGAAGLGNGDPVGVVADGDTVYSNGPSLYVANDQRWRVLPWLQRRNAEPKPEDEVTEIYQFDTSKPGRPVYVTSASVRGWLVNQYAMSEWDGHLRVATTSGRTWGDAPKSSSTVYVFRAADGALKETGRVTGLGKGERIYAVRFAGTTGYVVTFRQTDPLYTVDLSNPAKPRVAGELKITGYSAYLHPTEPGRVIGIGQEATTDGRAQGTQISLFDVSNLDKPARLTQHHVKSGHSEAEYDPHAFLYWPKERLLVVPLWTYDGNSQQSGALALRVTDSGFTEVGQIRHSGDPGAGTIRRSLVVGDTLWTVSDAGLLATGMSTMDTRTWLKWGN